LRNYLRSIAEMPKLTIDGRTADVAEGQRLVLAIESQGVPIGHRCGGFARCTTCRVEFQSGEPDTMTKAEYTILSTRDLLGSVRLSCQIVCDHDMSVHPVMTKDNQESWDTTGPAPEPTVTPEAQWYPRSEVAEAAKEGTA
jgi:ferredoxin